MRCVHCGKEVRNNIVFCIHCGRPVKREYSHYACEYYDGLSFWDKFLNLLNGVSMEKKDYRQDARLRMTTTKNVNIKNVIKNKQNSIQELYASYTNESAANTNPKRVHGDGRRIDTHESSNVHNKQGAENFNVNNVKDSMQKSFKNFANSSEEETSASIMKTLGIILAIIFAIIRVFSGS
ncbi:zinc ribbon domain-containing protein [Aminipila terrae]|uniref:Zinc-ribbon domain-containing protein n=1 Tax=Aminipila terrae TaxID=2697030 RepID=A0A6P1MID8_9FIRM|nr:zinc ribbon domain-containing protein [Aminipila terrae]QHI73667.1 zinc-ribbon domain-containing protein [Aminipila terrae]